MLSFLNEKSKLFKNWLSAAGATLATSAFFAFILLFAIDIFARQSNPYIGILAYIVAPAFFFGGTAMMFWGFRIQRRHVAAGSHEHPIIIDLTRGRDRRILQFFVAGGLAFLLVTAIGVTQTYHYTESTHFCGEACHGPMHPERTTYLTSPHARVSCVECHVGAGAEYYVKAKLNGLHQLKGVILNDYHRPIPTPIRNLRPAQDTCEQCHWPEKLSGNLDRTYTHFLSDETNSSFSVRLNLFVGTANSPGHPTGNGIHWHISQTNKVEYFASDPQRQTIPWVRVTHSDGTTTVYRSPDFKGEPPADDIRRMDCLDCHNRPAHRYRTPNESIDTALATGAIDRSLPWVKSNLVAILTVKYETKPEALQKIADHLRGVYKDSPKVEPLVAHAQKIFSESFFPEMKADWRAYPDNKGHKEWPGCFRCHDGLHTTADSQRKIGGSDCNSCHVILAQGSTPDDMKKLSAEGHAFFHIDAEYSDLSCNGCHTGGPIRE